MRFRDRHPSHLPSPLLLWACLFLVLGLGSAVLGFSPSVLPSLLAWLDLSRQTRASVTPWWTQTVAPLLPAASAGFILTAVFFFLLRHQADRLLQRFTESIVYAGPGLDTRTRSLSGMTRRSLLIWFSICLALILARYWPTLAHGFFRYDDFALLSFNRTHSLADIIFVPHDDHTYSLFRLQLSALAALFGVSPLPYNITLLATFVFLLLFLVLIMREMDVTAPGILVALALVTGLAAWGETISGYYTQMIHPQMALFCLAAIWTYIRWERTSRCLLRPVSAFFMALAPFVDISGVWVPPAVLVFAVCYYFANHPAPGVRHFLTTRAWVPVATFVVLVLVAAFDAYVFTIVAPGRFLVLLDESLPANTPHSIANIAQQFFFIVAGGILLPPFFPIGYWRLPPSVLVPILAGLFLVVTATVLLVSRRMDHRERWYGLSLLLITLGSALMAVLARGYQGFGHAWPSKYIGTPYLFSCALVGLLWHATWKRAQPTTRPFLLSLTTLSLLTFLGLQTTFDFITSRIQSQPPGFGSGYLTNISDARIRKNALREIRNDFIIPLSRSTDDGLRIPTLDGAYINDVYPSLYSFNNLSHYRAFILPRDQKLTFLRNTSMQTDTVARDVETVRSLRGASDSGFIEALQNDAYLQRLYLASVPLQFRRLHCKSDFPRTIPSPRYLTSAARVIRSNGRDLLFDTLGQATLPVRAGHWDPEVAHLLEIEITSSNHEPFRFELSFWGQLAIPYPRPWVELLPRETHCISVDLLQIYGYALNPAINRLAVTFLTPGTYNLSHLALRP